jgi:hypothetical protein
MSRWIRRLVDSLGVELLWISCFGFISVCRLLLQLGLWIHEQAVIIIGFCKAWINQELCCAFELTSNDQELSVVGNTSCTTPCVAM